MERRRRSLNAPQDDNQPKAKRRRTLMESVTNVAKMLLPSWADNTEEDGPGLEVETEPNQEVSAGVASSSVNNTASSSSRTNHGSATTSMPPLADNIGTHRHSTRKVLTREEDQDNAYHSDSGSDSSTSGCSSLSFSGGNAAQAQNIGKDNTDASRSVAAGPSSANNKSRREQMIDFTARSRKRSLLTSNDAAPSTRDVSVNVDNSAIVADMSGYNPSQSSFSLFSKSNRGVFSSTLNSTMPATLDSARNRSLSSSLQKPELSLNKSLFYDGKTTYGGAANYRRLNLFAPSPYQALSRSSRSNASAASSSTAATQGNAAAKQLIQALERMNTPVANAKRIPIPSTRCSSSSSQKTAEDASTRRKEALESIAQIRSNGPPTSMSNKVMSARIGRNVTPVMMSGGAAMADKQTTYLIDLEGSDINRALNPAMPDLCMITSTPRVSGADSSAMQREEKGGGKMKSSKKVSHYHCKPSIDEEEPQPMADLPLSNPLTMKSMPSFKFTVTSSSPASTTVTSLSDINKTSVSVSSDRSEGGVKITSTRSPLTSLADFSNKPFDTKGDNAVVCTNADFPIRPPIELVKGGSANSTSKSNFTIRVPEQLVKDLGNSINAKSATMNSEFNSISAKKSNFDNGVTFALNNESDKKIESVAKKNVSWGSEFKKSAGQWDCPTCLVTNQSSSDKCVACETAKPVAKSSSSTFSAPSDTISASKVDSAADWSCDTCWVKNKSSASKCCACETAKPCKKTAEVSNSWGDKFKKPSGQWSCSTCLLSNSSDASKCIACEAPNPNKTLTISSSQASSIVLPAQSSSSGFGSLFKMKPGWDCDTCLIRNKQEDSKCCACETPKPGSAPAPSNDDKDLSKNNVAPTSTFKFGVPSSAVSSDSQNKDPVVAVSSVFGGAKVDKPESAPSTFTFGVPKSSAATADSSTSVVASTGFKFGAPASKDNEAKADATAKSPFSGIKFGATPIATSTAPTSEAPKAVFTFGAAATSTVSQASTATTSASGFGGFAFGTPAQTTAPTTATNAQASVPAKPTFAFGGFGVPAEKAPASSASSTEGTTTAASTPFSSLPMSKPAAPSSGFTFGAPAASESTTAPITSVTSGNVFGKPISFTDKAAGSAAPATTASSLFGGTTFGSSVTSSANLFGAASTTSTAASPAQAITAVSTSSVTQLSFAAPANSATAPSSLLNSQSASPAASNMFAFGSAAAPPAVSAAPGASPFVFGASNASSLPTTATPQKPSTGFNFGAASNTPSQGFSFGATPAAAATPSGSTMFTFGATPATPAAPAPVPSGLTAPTAATPSSSFVFGPSAQVNTPQGSGMFAFGSTQAAATPIAPNPAAGSTPFQFGTPTGVPQFNTPAAPGFAFAPPTAANPFSTADNPTLAGRKMKRAVRRKTPR